MKWFAYFFILTITITSGVGASSANKHTKIPAEAFARFPTYEVVKVSPDGRYFAATIPSGEQTGIAIIALDGLKPKQYYKLLRHEHVDFFDWATNNKIIYSRSLRVGTNDKPHTYGEIFVIDLENNQNKILFGQRASQTSTGSRIKKTSGTYKKAMGEVLSMMSDDPKNILISSRKIVGKTQDIDRAFTIYRLNVKSGKLNRVASTPFGNLDIIVTHGGIVKYAYGRDKQSKYRAFKFVDENWQEIQKDDILYHYKPLSTNADGSISYFLDRKTNTTALYAFDEEKKSLAKLFQHPKLDVDNFLFDPMTRDIIGVRMMPGKPKTIYFDKKQKTSKILNGLSKAFKGETVNLESSTRDGNQLIITVSSDKNSGDYFLYDQKKKDARWLLAKKEWLNPDWLAEVEPVTFEARDGESLHGYITWPKHLTQNKLPLVVNVHGGPFGVRDRWRYDSENQWLANNGYAVLQINYRGSGGYGANFEEVAYQKRSTLIQNDILDGTRWAAQLKKIDSDKICIMGWSFGGYSAVMAPIKAPELFKCSVAAAGPYDLVYQSQNADYAEIKSLRGEIEEAYSSDVKLLKTESPLTYIDDFNVPVFIIHGGKDQRVPPQHAYLLRDALKARDKPYEWLYKPTEGHGFFDIEHREEYYKKLVVFLDKHLKP
ncbi:MAG: S9 family peptidase [Pseudomonadota bacterium]